MTFNDLRKCTYDADDVDDEDDHRVIATNLLQQLATCPVQRMNVVVRKIVDKFPPVTMQRHAQAVTEARETDGAVDLNKDVTCSDVTVA